MSAEDDEYRAPGGLGEAPPRFMIEGPILALLMAVLVGITFANVVLRYLTNRSIAFTEEYSVVIMVVVALVGSASAFARDRHIRVAFFVDRLAPSKRVAAEYALLALAIVFFAAVFWYGGRYAWDEYRFEVLSPGLGNPQWMYSLAMPVFSALILLRLLGRLVRIARRGRG